MVVPEQVREFFNDLNWMDKVRLADALLNSAMHTAGVETYAVEMQGRHRETIGVLCVALGDKGDDLLNSYRNLLIEWKPRSSGPSAEMEAKHPIVKDYL